VRRYNDAGNNTTVGFRGLAWCALLVVLAPLSARGESEATLFRLFLLDGTTLVSYGEYARLADSVVFSMPVGGPDSDPRLHVVTVPSGQIDWNRTDRYAASARYQRYAETRGERDFAQLTNDVARILNDIALNTDRAQALAIAEQARTALAEWPQAHYGYRQRDVAEIVMLLDEAISDLRAADGLNRFDLALIATPVEIEYEPLLGMPSAREQLSQIARTVGLAARSSDRIALLQSALALMGESRPGTPGAIPFTESEAFRTWAENRIRAEQFMDGRYADLSRRMMSSANQAAANGRVADIERILEQLPVEDARLGHRRPETVAALRASVGARLDSARELRLARDRWTLRRGLYQDYQRSMGVQLLQLVKAQPALEAVRRLQGPTVPQLVDLKTALAGGAARLVQRQVPSDLQGTHDLVVSAWRFAENAFDARYRAVQTGSVTTAWEASSAAAGSLLMLSRAQRDLSALLEPPRLQ